MQLSCDDFQRGDVLAAIRHGPPPGLVQETDISHVQTYPASQSGHVRLSLTTRELLGRDDDYLNALDRAHNAHRSAGDNLPVVRYRREINVSN
jgi:hypothetical protein